MHTLRIRGARTHNLRNVDLTLPRDRIIVFTGLSGSGKSSLAFDTLYAEGQRRYVETFSAYARQFLDRMDKPQVDRIDGVPPAIAIDQTNPVRTSRSTVGTMTELNDHLKLLFARAATLHCRRCAQPVRRDTVEGVVDELGRRAAAAGDPRLVISFPVTVPANFDEQEVTQHLLAQGYTRVHARTGSAPNVTLSVVQDRLRAGSAERRRIAEAVEVAMRRSHGRLTVHVLNDEGADAQVWRFSSGLHCADCDIAYADPLPSLFSFNSPIGACEACRGFGRVIGIDLGLVIPDENKSLREGAVKPWQTESFKECQRDLARLAAVRGVPMDVPWREMRAEHRARPREGARRAVPARRAWAAVPGAARPAPAGRKARCGRACWGIRSRTICSAGSSWESTPRGRASWRRGSPATSESARGRFARRCATWPPSAWWSCSPTAGPGCDAPRPRRFARPCGSAPSSSPWLPPKPAAGSTRAGWVS